MDGYRHGVPEQGYAAGPGYDRQYPAGREYPAAPRRPQPTQPMNVPPGRDPRLWE